MITGDFPMQKIGIIRIKRYCRRTQHIAVKVPVIQVLTQILAFMLQAHFFRLITESNGKCNNAIISCSG
jgi:hypothetical protein